VLKILFLMFFMLSESVFASDCQFNKQTVFIKSNTYDSESYFALCKNEKACRSSHLQYYSYEKIYLKMQPDSPELECIQAIFNNAKIDKTLGSVTISNADERSLQKFIAIIQDNPHVANLTFRMADSSTNARLNRNNKAAVKPATATPATATPATATPATATPATATPDDVKPDEPTDAP